MVDGTEGTIGTPPAADPVADKLKELGVAPEFIAKIKSDLGAETVDDLSSLTVDDLTMVGIKKIPARRLLAALNPNGDSVATTPAGTAVLPTFAPGPISTFIIPDAIEGPDFLSALSASKTLVVDDLSIRAALETLYADDLGLSTIPERLCDLIELAADEAEVPAGEQVTEILRFVRERRYAEVHVDSRLVTKERKEKVLKRLRELPSVMYQFHAIVMSWYQQLETIQRANPLGVLSPTGRLFPPPDDVIGGAEMVVACLSKAFAGFGVQVARAMAYEGMKIREIMNRPELPALTGAMTRELMLKKLGCELTNADVRTERAVASYVLFVATQVPTKLPAGQEGPPIEALYNLGQRILPWMQANIESGREGGQLSGIGSGRGKNKTF